MCIHVCVAVAGVCTTLQLWVANVAMTTCMLLVPMLDAEEGEDFLRIIDSRAAATAAASGVRKVTKRRKAFKEKNVYDNHTYANLGDGVLRLRLRFKLKALLVSRTGGCEGGDVRGGEGVDGGGTDDVHEVITCSSDDGLQGVGHARTRSAQAPAGEREPIRQIDLCAGCNDALRKMADAEQLMWMGREADIILKFLTDGAVRSRWLNDEEWATKAYEREMEKGGSVWEARFRHVPRVLALKGLVQRYRPEDHVFEVSGFLPRRLVTASVPVPEEVRLRAQHGAVGVAGSSVQGGGEPVVLGAAGGAATNVPLREQPRPVEGGVDPVAVAEQVAHVRRLGVDMSVEDVKDVLDMKPQVVPSLLKLNRDECATIAAVLGAAMRKDATGSTNFFITGPGGTGKTAVCRILGCLLTRRRINHALTAYTNAATNELGGKRSFAAELGIAFYKERHNMAQQQQLVPRDVLADLRETKKKIVCRFSDMRVLFVDEASMIPADEFQVLMHMKRYLNIKLVVVLCGDFHQLPAVVKNAPADSVAYAFESAAWTEANMRYHVLTHYLRGDEGMRLTLEKVGCPVCPWAVRAREHLQRVLPVTLVFHGCLCCGAWVADGAWQRGRCCHCVHEE